MQPIPNTTRFNSQSEEQWKVRDFTGAIIEDKNDLIKKAAQTPLERIFKYYHINLNEHLRKVVCPFKSHSGGREGTPSFTYYPDTNSYHCFGCRQGSTCVDLVSIIENISKTEAAKKILNLFENDSSDEDLFVEKINYSEQLEIMLVLSKEIREFRQKYIDEQSNIWIDNLSEAYDNFLLKNDLPNEALKSFIEQMSFSIRKYQESK